MKIAIIKYNAGNLFSVDCALKRLGVEPIITHDKETLLSADKVIFPGVGEARTTMDYLKGCGLDQLIKDLKQPVLGHMGWNTLSHLRSPLFQGLKEEEFVYFVHSFYVPVNEFTAATTEYITPFSAALHKDNFYATQFHPEKSGKVGECILRNFLNL